MDRTDPIIVQGFTPRYAAAFRELLGIEGGHVNDKYDMGGETRFGISLRFLKAAGAIDLDGDGFADFDLDFDGDIDGADIRKLTVGDARYLFHRDFWLPVQCDSFPRPIGEMLFDQAVNGGAVAAKKMLQRALNNCIVAGALVTEGWRMGALKIDGQLGPATRAALDAVLKSPAQGMPKLVGEYRTEVKARYLAIVGAHPKQQRFLKGWLARADRLGRV